MTITTEQTDALTEVFNIGVGQAASMLSDLISTRIILRVPNVTICPRNLSRENLRENGLDNPTTIMQKFNGPINGQACLLFPEHDGLTLANLLSDDDNPADALNSESSGILLEVGNIVLNGVMGSLSNLLDYRFNYEVPRILENVPVIDVLANTPDGPADNASLLLANTLFKVADQDIAGSILIAFEIGAVESLLQALDALA